MVLVCDVVGCVCVVVCVGVFEFCDVCGWWDVGDFECDVCVLVLDCDFVLYCVVVGV